MTLGVILDPYFQGGNGNTGNRSSHFESGTGALQETRNESCVPRSAVTQIRWTANFLGSDGSTRLYPGAGSGGAMIGRIGLTEVLACVEMLLRGDVRQELLVALSGSSIKPLSLNSQVHSFLLGLPRCC